MEILQGYAYHIKDSYFEFANDDNLMQNKEQGNYRPTLYCIKDDRTELYCIGWYLFRRSMKSFQR